MLQTETITVQNLPHLCLLHQSLWKICVYFYLGFVALLPKHHLCLHSALAHGNGPIFLKVSCTFSNVLQCVILQSGYCCRCFTTTALSFPLQNPHMKCMSAYSSFLKCVMNFNYNYTATQHSYTSLDSVQAGTSSNYSSSIWLHLHVTQ